jgi:hypothetical protein
LNEIHDRWTVLVSVEPAAGLYGEHGGGAESETFRSGEMPMSSIWDLPPATATPPGGITDDDTAALQAAKRAHDFVMWVLGPPRSNSQMPEPPNDVSGFAGGIGKLPDAVSAGLSASIGRPPEFTQPPRRTTFPDRASAMLAGGALGSAIGNYLGGLVGGAVLPKMSGPAGGYIGAHIFGANHDGELNGFDLGPPPYP